MLVFLLAFWGQGFTLWLRMAWSSVCRPRSPVAQGCPHVSVSQVPGLYVWDTCLASPSLPRCLEWDGISGQFGFIFPLWLKRVNIFSCVSWMFVFLLRSVCVFLTHLFLMFQCVFIYCLMSWGSLHALSDVRLVKLVSCSVGITQLTLCCAETKKLLCVYLCVCLCAHVYVCVYTCMYVCVYTYMSWVGVTLVLGKWCARALGFIESSAP